MKTHIFPYQIHRIIGDKYQDLHRVILGVDISSRHIRPITKDVYYVHPRDPLGLTLVQKNTPAICSYTTGEIFCLYDKRIPLTEARLVHEFLHRAARHRYFFRQVSGIDTHRKYTFLNEIITEYLTMRLVGNDYYQQISPNNRYAPMLHLVEKLEKKIGLTALTRAYLYGKRRTFAPLIRALSSMS